MSTPIEPIAIRAPNDLTVTAFSPRRVLIVGSCLSERWAIWMTSLPEPCESDVYLLGSALPEKPAKSIGDYDFQIVQLALRFVLPDASFARLAQADRSGHQELFAHALNATRRQLADAMRWNKEQGILTFVFPYVVPVQNMIGRLLPRYDLCNPVYFIERLNEALSRELEEYQNAYLFDINEIHAFYGKRFVQEDLYAAFNHGSYISDFDFQYDGGRLEPPIKASELLEQQLWTVFGASWNELLAMYRTVRQHDMVKMVVVDLDDTLWRGVAAEADPENLPTSEGWPKGLWEALLVLKRRGILLAIISKNDEIRILNLWNNILKRFLSLEDFVARRIKWTNKSENMSSILSDVNISPRNVVYIDDNPVERAAIKASFPDIRVLSGQPLTWRRILLWSPETQVSEITQEASKRTQMVQSQVVREERRRTMPRDDFLATLQLKVGIFEIDSVDHQRLGRALELINRTNQFNTTGLRWSREDCITAFAQGRKFIAFVVEDRFTDYGLVGAAVVGEASILQFVMSCRVIGLSIEDAVMSHVVERFRSAGVGSLVAEMICTDRNLPCQNLYERLGFSVRDGQWVRSTEPSIPSPRFIELQITPPVELPNSLRPTVQSQPAVPPATRVDEGTSESLATEPAGVDVDLTQGRSDIVDIEDLKFGRDGNDTPHLVSGWSGPEPRQRWTSGNCCELQFDRPSSENLILILDASPRPAAPPNRPSQRAVIYCDDTLAGAITFRQAGQQAIRLPAIDQNLQTPLRIRIELPDAVRGTEAGLSNDARCLALCFRRLRLLALPLLSQFRQGNRAPVRSQSAGVAEYLRPDELLREFESLGECRDFGDIQRRAGVKPQGFLHRSGMPLRALVNAIENGFDGFGDPAALEAVFIPPDGEVTAVSDRNYNISFLPDGRMTRLNDEAWKERCSLEMRRLRDRMFAGFKLEKRVFVFQKALKSEPLTEAEILPLFAAVRRWGKAPVLFVTTAHGEHAPGSVVEIVPGLFSAYLPPPGSEAAQTWTTICNRVWALVTSQATSLSQ